MDFLDPKKRKRHSIQLFIGYALVAIAILLATTTLIYFAYGFDVTRQGELVQKGLVFVSSEPAGAQLYINSKQVETTNTKLNLAAGNYTLDIKRNGYYDWHRSITVDGGSVDHFVYPLLFPKKLEQKAVKTYDSPPRLTTPSPDRRWLLVQPNAQDERQFEVFDLSKGQDQVGTATSFTVPENLLTASEASTTWKVMEWSNNNRHVLFQRTYTANGTHGTEYILLDRQRPEGSHNLSKELDINAAATTITLFDKKPDVYYAHNKTTGELSRLSLNDPTPQRVLSDVVAYKSHGSKTIVYITAKGAPKGKVFAKLLDDGKVYFLRNVAASNLYLLNAARFDGKWYVVAGSQTEGRAFIYEDPATQINDTKERKAGALFSLRVDNPSDVSFSANAQFIALQNGKDAHIYDIDHERAYRYKLAYALDAPQTKILWMDGSRFSYVSGGKAVVFDYDNINRHRLVSASSVYEPTYDRNYKYLYTFTPRANGEPGLALTATPIRTENDL